MGDKFRFSEEERKTLRSSYAEGTVTRKESELTEFFKFAEEEFGIKWQNKETQIVPMHIMAFTNMLSRRAYAFQTVVNYISSTNSFLEMVGRLNLSRTAARLIWRNVHAQELKGWED